MKRKILVLMVMVTGLLITTSLRSDLSAQDAKVKTEMAKTKKYSCPHHPGQVSDKPGKCAVCGMDLVEVVDINKDHMMKKKDAMHDKMKMEGDSKKMDMDKMKKDSKDMKMDMKDMKKDMEEMKKDSSKMMMDKKM